MEVLYIQYMILILLNQVYSTKTLNPVDRSTEGVTAALLGRLLPSDGPKLVKNPEI